ncbi:hypothetical protein [Candidatus Odyssella acanthamoebae]|nr:hypothetical protein [Candidatus Paracaedibacter acanthamoebae]
MDSASSFLQRSTGILGSKLSDSMPGSEKLSTILHNICCYYLQPNHTAETILKISKDLVNYYENLVKLTNRASFHRLHTIKIDKNIFENIAFLARPYGHESRSVAR